jgi:tetratricopeptide (TPR) repeat protein
MMSCIFVLYLALSPPAGYVPPVTTRFQDSGAAVHRADAADPDALYARRSDLASAREAGIEAGRTAVAIRPDRPEGHFWIAANMGALAQSFGLRQGLKYRGDIRTELLTVLRLDPAFQQGSADRALGRWYYKVPGMFGGSTARSEEHLRKSLTYNPDSTATHYFLAETLLGAGRKEEARAELQKVIDAPLDPQWTPEDREFKQQARALLSKTEPRK